ncbi:MAG: ATPase, T2SS/T4P/T4SS family [Candidatus Altiarchaeota archaeon]
MAEVLHSYDNVKIMEGESGQIPYYVYLAPELTDEERRILGNCRTIVGDTNATTAQLTNIRTTGEKEAYLREFLRGKIKNLNVKPENAEYMVSSMMDEVFLGYGRLGPLIRDEQLEEIMVNNVNSPVFVVHRRYGMCITNLMYETHEPLNNLVQWLARYANRELSEQNPLLDAQMPDGSRVNVAIPPAAPFGPAVTIRKFRKIPYNILDLIELGSISTELAAFLWVCIEGLGLSPVDLILAGGAGSGKTTLLNALAMFIPKTERVITVEDTMELNFDFIENWVPLEASPTATDQSNYMSMHSMLRNSLRMRPDRVIVGEVRGSEAETLFVAMDIGLDGSMGTLHANNARETTIRLMGEPMNVPIRMMPLLNLIVVINRLPDRKKGGMYRRVTQVAEVSGTEGDVVHLGDIFAYDITTDAIKRTNYPILLLEKIANKCGITKKTLLTELLVREKVLQYMINKGIKDNSEVVRFFHIYHCDPKAILSRLKKDGQMPNIQE